MSDPLSTETKLYCCNCAHLIGRRYDIDSWEKWHCGNPENVRAQVVNPVNGISYQEFRVEFCKDVRTAPNLCGSEGKWFTYYEKPAFEPVRETNKSFADTSADKLLELRTRYSKGTKKLTKEDLNNL